MSLVYLRMYRSANSSRDAALLVLYGAMSCATSLISQSKMQSLRHLPPVPVFPEPSLNSDWLRIREGATLIGINFSWSWLSSSHAQPPLQDSNSHRHFMTSAKWVHAWPRPNVAETGNCLDMESNKRRKQDLSHAMQSLMQNKVGDSYLNALDHPPSWTTPVLTIFITQYLHRLLTLLQSNRQVIDNAPPKTTYAFCCCLCRSCSDHLHRRSLHRHSGAQ